MPARYFVGMKCLQSALDEIAGSERRGLTKTMVEPSLVDAGRPDSVVMCAGLAQICDADAIACSSRSSSLMLCSASCMIIRVEGPHFSTRASVSEVSSPDSFLQRGFVRMDSSARCRFDLQYRAYLKHCWKFRNDAHALLLCYPTLPSFGIW